MSEPKKLDLDKFKVCVNPSPPKKSNLPPPGPAKMFSFTSGKKGFDLYAPPSAKKMPPAPKEK